MSKSWPRSTRTTEPASTWSPATTSCSRRMARRSIRCFRPPRRVRWVRRARPCFSALLRDAPRFGAGLDPAAIEALKARNDLKLIDLRTIAVQGMVAAEHVPPLAEAKAVLGWHARHRFCPNCSAATRVTQGGWRRDCPVLQGRTFSAHRSGGDHAADRRRSLRARPFAALSANHVVVSRRFRRTRRIDRGSGAARSGRGSRPRLRAGQLFRLTALAVSRRR